MRRRIPPLELTEVVEEGRIYWVPAAGILDAFNPFPKKLQFASRKECENYIQSLRDQKVGGVNGT